MKALHVSDLHGNFTWLSWCEAQASRYDLIVIAGDLLDQFTADEMKMRREADRMVERLRRLPAGPTWALVTGNHDVWEDANPAYAWGAWLDRARRADVMVDGSISAVGDRQVVCRAYVGCRLNLASKPSIVVNHVPPAGTSTATEHGTDQGDWEVADVVSNLPAGTVICSGHVHSADSWHDRLLGRIICLNPGYDRRAKIPNFISVDTDLHRAAWHVNGMVEDVISLAPKPTR